MEAIKSIKNGKSSGFDDITAEHIKHGGAMLIELLVCVFNSVTVNEEIPPCFKKGVIIPIPKGKKDATQMNNNRGITLIPVIAKLYEKILLARHLQWTKINGDDIINLQGAAQPGCSSNHTTWMLRETVSANTEQGSTVYVALIDASKAFDTVWIDGLF